MTGMLFAGMVATASPSLTNGPAAAPEGQATNRWDRMHDSLYMFVQRRVAVVDSWFISDGMETRPVPQPRFRLGMFGTMETGAGTNGSFSVTPLVDGDAEITLPNAEKRLRLLVTTTDPTVLPEESLEKRDTSLRLGVMRDWMDSWQATIGVKMSFSPDVYAKLTSGRCYPMGPVRLYPHQKVYWEAAEGVGAVSSVMADYWRGRLDFKYSGSMKWSEDLQERDAGGWLWEQSLGCLYVSNLLDEADYGRRVSGGDIANGGGARLFVSGGLKAMELYRLEALGEALGVRINIQHLPCFVKSCCERVILSLFTFQSFYSFTMGLILSGRESAL